MRTNLDQAEIVQRLEEVEQYVRGRHTLSDEWIELLAADLRATLAALDAAQRENEALRVRLEFAEAFFPSRAVVDHLTACADFFGGTSTRPNVSTQQFEAGQWLNAVRAEWEERER